MRQYSIDDLVYLMKRLRDPEYGCPWDQKQTFDSLASHTIEEAYEVIDALSGGEPEHIREELGDLLLQVIFYSQIASEDSLFTFREVVHSLVEKLVRRHPHVFKTGELYETENESEAKTPEEVMTIWKQIKLQEDKKKNNSDNKSLLSGVARALPALKRGQKIQEKAAVYGFDWPETRAVFDKLREEIDELEKACADKDKANIQEEAGDLLFSVVNLSRHLKIDAERAMDKACDKFIGRFHFIEKTLADQKRSPQDCGINELDTLWEQAKQQG